MIDNAKYWKQYILCIYAMGYNFASRSLLSYLHFNPYHIPSEKQIKSFKRSFKE